MDSFGVQCRQATTTHRQHAAEPREPGQPVEHPGTNVDVPITASDADGNTLTFSATGLPPGLDVNPSTGRITGVPTTLGDYSVTLTAFDGTASTSVNFCWAVTQQPPFSLSPLPATQPRQVDTAVTYTASSANGTNVQYMWFFDDGTPPTDYSSSPTMVHTFAQPGVYYVTVTAVSDGSTCAVRNGYANDSPAAHRESSHGFSRTSPTRRGPQATACGW